MKTIKEVLNQYLLAMQEVDIDRFSASFHGFDSTYAKKVIKTLEHIFYDAYGNGSTETKGREYILAPTVLSSKRAEAAVLGVYLCVMDSDGMGKKADPLVLQIYVPERYKQSDKLKEFLLWADYVNKGKIVYCGSDQTPKPVQSTQMAYRHGSTM